MKVKMITCTPNAEKIIASAAKLCYSAVGIDDIMDNLTEENTEKFLNMLMSYGHASPIEHVSFTFAVEGVSRSLTHQLVRHRIASYSQQSQRYVKLDQFEYITPPSIKNSSYLNHMFEKHMDETQNLYDNIVSHLKFTYIENGMREKDAEKKAIEDARYIFPNACETKIVFTMNARTLLNFLNHRCCSRAQWEIQELAWQIRSLLIRECPIIFKLSGPSCVKGKCPEGTMTCGKTIEMREKVGILNANR